MRPKLPNGTIIALKKALNVSEPTIRTYLDQGCPLEPAAATEWVRENKSKGSKGRTAIGETARLRRLQADREEIEVRQLRGELVEVDAVDASIMAGLSLLRAGMRSLGPRVAPQVARMTDEAEIQRHVGAEVDRILAEAEAALRGWAVEGLEKAGAAAGAAAAADGGSVG